MGVHNMGVFVGSAQLSELGGDDAALLGVRDSQRRFREKIDSPRVRELSKS